MSDHAPSAYDPYKEQPRTLDNLGGWVRARLIASPLVLDSRFPVSLDPPKVSGLAELRAYSLAEFRTDLTTWEPYLAIRGKYCRAVCVSDEEAGLASLQEVAVALSSTPANHPHIRKPGRGPKKQKRSTIPEEALVKIISKLTEHHQYENGSCLNTTPIGNNELARKATVANSTACLFFQKHFKGYGQYRVVCRDPSKLAASIKLLRGEFSPHLLYGANPPGEGSPDK
jgi:hypothetical protein